MDVSPNRVIQVKKPFAGIRSKLFLNRDIWHLVGVFNINRILGKIVHQALLIFQRPVESSSVSKPLKPS